MKGVPAYSSTWGRSITFDDLHVTYSTQIIFVFVLLLHYDISSIYFNFGVFEKFLDFIVMNASIGNDVPQFFVIVVMPEE